MMNNVGDEVGIVDFSLVPGFTHDCKSQNGVVFQLQPDSVEDLQKMFVDMVTGEAFNFDFNVNTNPAPKCSPVTGSNRGGGRRNSSRR